VVFVKEDELSMTGGAKFKLGELRRLAVRKLGECG
jgi:hypothetical protein